MRTDRREFGWKAGINEIKIIKTSSGRAIHVSTRSCTTPSTPPHHLPGDRCTWDRNHVRAWGRGRYRETVLVFPVGNNPPLHAGGSMMMSCIWCHVFHGTLSPRACGRARRCDADGFHGRRIDREHLHVICSRQCSRSLRHVARWSCCCCCFCFFAKLWFSDFSKIWFLKFWNKNFE